GWLAGEYGGAIQLDHAPGGIREQHGSISSTSSVGRTLGVYLDEVREGAAAHGVVAALLHDANGERSIPIGGVEVPATIAELRLGTFGAQCVPSEQRELHGVIADDDVPEGFVTARPVVRSGGRGGGCGGRVARRQ